MFFVIMQRLTFVSTCLWLERCRTLSASRHQAVLPGNKLDASFLSLKELTKIQPFPYFLCNHTNL